MNSFELIAALATALGVITFSAIFTILYRSYAKASLKELAMGKRDVELMDEYIYSSQPAVKRRRRVWKAVKGVCFYALLLLLIPLFLLSIWNRINGNVMMVGDRALMVVASGSMSQRNRANAYLDTMDLNNQFNTYDTIVLERVESEAELSLYDVIAFVDDTGKNVIHRIIGIKDQNGTVCYETRGDSNNQSDAYSPTVKDVIGRYTDTKIPTLGALIMFFQSLGGMITLMSLVYCLLMLDRSNAEMSAREGERLARICETIGLDPTQRAEKLSAEFTETLYYKGYAYHFNEKGFIGKDEITDTSYLKKSDSAAIRVLDADGEHTEEELFINFEEGDEKTP